MRSLSRALVVAAMFMGLSGVFSSVSAHCQVPCGIYDDEARFASMNEDITTVEKAMKELTTLSDKEAAGTPLTPTDHNQIVRWVTTKDKHADHLAETISYYFLAQRVKLPALDLPQDKLCMETCSYNQKLTTLHHMLIYAMKTKQAIDLATVEKLKTLSQQFKDLYSGKSLPCPHGNTSGSDPKSCPRAKSSGKSGEKICPMSP